MGTITILCSVAADFKSGGMTYSIGSKDLNIIKQAPEWIADTLLFKLLVKDGSMKCVTSANRVQLENEPTLGISAEGKKVVADESVAEVVAESDPDAPAVGEQKKEEPAVEEKPKTRKKATAKVEEADA